MLGPLCIPHESGSSSPTGLLTHFNQKNSFGSERRQARWLHCILPSMYIHETQQRWNSCAEEVMHHWMKGWWIFWKVHCGMHAKGEMLFQWGSEPSQPHSPGILHTFTSAYNDVKICTVWDLSWNDAASVIFIFFCFCKQLQESRKIKIKKIYLFFQVVSV